MDHESVARLGTFDVEGACLRIGPLAALHASGVNAARIDREGDNVIAWLDTQRGFMRAGEGVVELCGLKPMGFSEAGRSQRKRQEQQFHLHPPVWESISEQLLPSCGR